MMKYSQFLFKLEKNTLLKSDRSYLSDPSELNIVNGSRRPKRFLKFGRLSLLTAIGLSINACGNSPLVVSPDELGIGGDGSPKLALVDKEYTGKDSVNVRVLGPINKKIQIFNDKGTQLGEATTDNKGNAIIALKLDEGTHTIKARSKISDTIVKDSDPVNVQIDRDAKKLTINKDEKTLETDSWLNKEELSQFILKGSNAEGQAKIEVEITKNTGKPLTFEASKVNSEADSLSEKKASIEATYDWQIETSKLLELNFSDGDEAKIRVKQTDKADNIGEFSDVFTLMVDITPPGLLGDMPISASYGEKEIRISFDDILSGDVEADKINISGNTKNGRDISVNTNKGVTLSSDKTQIIFYIEDELEVGDQINTVKYTGSNLKDEAGNKVEEFTLEWKDFQINTSGTIIGGNETPTGLKIKLKNNSDSGIKNDDYSTNEINPVFVVEGVNLNSSVVVLKLKNKATGVVLVAAEAYADNDSVDLTVGKLLKKDNHGKYTTEVLELASSLHLNDGEYEIEIETQNKNPVKGSLKSSESITIDTKAPGILSDASGVIRESSNKFLVKLSEEAYIVEGQKDQILTALSFIKANGNQLNLGAGESFGNILLINVVKTDGYEKFKSFSFEVVGRSKGGILDAIDKEKLVRLKIQENTFEDLSGNQNNEQSGTSTYLDVRPPSGEAHSYETKKLTLSFGRTVEMVAGADLNTITVTDNKDPTAVYDVINVGRVGDKLEITLSPTSPDVTDRELSVTIPENLLHFTGENWNNIEHDVLFDLRTPGTPKIELAVESDKGVSDSDHITNLNKPVVYFSLDSSSKGGDLNILVEGIDIHGNRVKHFLSYDNFNSSIMYSPSDFPTLEDGRYEIKAFIESQFGDVGKIGRLGGSGEGVRYTLEGKDAASFEISSEGVLTLKNHIDVTVGNNRELEVDIKIDYGHVSNTRSIKVTIEDSGTTLNSVPVFGSGLSVTASVAENTTAVGTFNATDADAGDIVSYSLQGNDAGLFSINNMGEINFIKNPDFENPYDYNYDNVYEISVIASDGKWEALHDLKVTVTDDDTEVLTKSNPVFEQNPRNSIVFLSDDMTSSTFVKRFFAFDQDGDSLIYRLEGVDRDRFTISNKGVLAFTEIPDFNNPSDDGADNIYDVTIVVEEDSASASRATHDLMIEVVNTLVDPKISFDSSLEKVLFIGENTKVAGSFASTDKDGRTVTYSLEGRDKDKFSVDSVGKVSFLDEYVPDFERGDRNYRITVVAEAGSDKAEHEVSINVYDVKESEYVIKDNQKFVTTIKPLDSEGIGGSLVVDTKAPELISLTPVFVISGTHKLFVSFSERIDATNISYGWFKPGGLYTIRASTPISLSDDGKVLILEIDPAAGDVGGSTFNFQYNKPISGGIRDIAGNYLESFNVFAEIIGKPEVDKSEWEDVSPDGAGDMDKIILTFNNKISAVGGKLDHSNIYLYDSVNFLDKTDPGRISLDPSVNIDITNNILTLTFSTTQPLLATDNLKLEIDSNTLGLSGGSIGTLVSLNDNIKVELDTEYPNPPVINGVSSSDYRTDQYINTKELNGDSPIVFSGMGEVGYKVFVRLERGSDVWDSDAKDSDSDWNFNLTGDDSIPTLKTLFMSLSDGDVVTVRAYHTETDGGNEIASTNELSLTVDTMSPTLVVAESAALSNTDILILKFNEELKQGDVKTGYFTLSDDLGATVTISSVDVQDRTVRLNLGSTIGSSLGSPEYTVSYTPGPDDIITDLAGNEAGAISSQAIRVKSIPVVEHIMVDEANNKLIITFISNISEYTTGGNSLGVDDFTISTYSITPSGVMIVGMNTLEVTFSSTDFDMFEDKTDSYDEHTIILMSDTVQEGTAGDPNLETEIKFDADAPTLVPLDLVADSDTGENTTDNITRDTTPTFELSSLENGGKVDITLSGPVNAMYSTDPTGSVMQLDIVGVNRFTIGSMVVLTDGDYTISVTEITDRYGNSVSGKEDLSFTIDTVAMLDSSAFMSGIMVNPTDTFWTIIASDVSGSSNSKIEIDFGYNAESKYEEIQVHYEIWHNLDSSSVVDPRLLANPDLKEKKVGVIKSSATSTASSFEISEEFVESSSPSHYTYIKYWFEDVAGNLSNFDTVATSIILGLDLLPQSFILDATSTMLTINNYGVSLINASEATKGISIQIIRGSGNPWTDVNEFYIRGVEKGSSFTMASEVFRESPTPTPYDLSRSFSAAPLINVGEYKEVQYKLILENTGFRKVEEFSNLLELAIDRNIPEVTKVLAFGGTANAATGLRFFTSDNIFAGGQNNPDNHLAIHKPLNDRLTANVTIDRSGTDVSPTLPVQVRQDKLRNESDSDKELNTTNGGYGGSFSISFSGFTYTSGGSTLPVSIMSGDSITITINSSANKFIGDIAGNSLSAIATFTYDGTSFDADGTIIAWDVTTGMISEMIIDLSFTDDFEDVGVGLGVEEKEQELEPFALSVNFVGVEDAMDDDGSLW